MRPKKPTPASRPVRPLTPRQIAARQKKVLAEEKRLLRLEARLLKQQLTLARKLKARNRKQANKARRAYQQALALLKKLIRGKLGPLTVDLGGGQGFSVVCDIYRTFDVNNPFGVTANNPDVPNVNGYLRHHLKAGRFGYQAKNLYWTHLLEIPLGTDIRSAYSSQNNPSFNISNADTVIIHDYLVAGKTTAFAVVMVQRVGRGTPQDKLRAYLDRAGADKPFCCRQIPETLHLTYTADSNCACLNGVQLTLTYNPLTSKWEGSTTACGQTLSVKFWCADATLGIGGFAYSFQCGSHPLQTIGPPLTATSCKPFLLTTSGLTTYGGCCPGPLQSSITLTFSQ
jgi:hypothetical protein